MPATARRIDESLLLSLDLTEFNRGENPFESGSIERGFRDDPKQFRSAIKYWNVHGCDRVLDLMCGYGRWSVFLAEANREVIGLDRNEGAINIARGMCARLGLTNATFFTGDVTDTSRFEDESFDAVWIWNALIYAERGPCLREVHRILRPGGRLVAGSTNSTGRLLQKLRFGLLIRDKTRRRNLRQAVRALWRGPKFDGAPNYITARTARAIFGRHGFEVLEVRRKDKKVLGVFDRSIDVLARKRDEST